MASGTGPAGASSVRPAPSAALSGPVAVASSSAAALVSASAAPLAPAADLVDLAAAPKLLADDGKPLGQTEARPSADSPAFKQRIALLWKAIVEDDPALADAAFFPSVAYQQVKDIEKPESDWKHRLMKAFARSIHDYHKKLGADAKAAVFVALDLDESRVKWMAPGKEGNKLGYHRVTRSRLRYRDGSGNEKKLELTSLISWRGEWFVVHLDGFK